ncbi:hypothetical protein SDC9_176659 [bioreactor metagenome]|uniref:Uncharacterized protein n=1 Tax=bioreactor metagenome TaxID=1076179 RepID=A0A645GQN6_9ZZZZ
MSFDDSLDLGELHQPDQHCSHEIKRHDHHVGPIDAQGGHPGGTCESTTNARQFAGCPGQAHGWQQQMNRHNATDHHVAHPEVRGAHHSAGCRSQQCDPGRQEPGDGGAQHHESHACVVEPHGA